MNALMRFEPNLGLRREIDRLFDDFLPAFSSNTPPGWSPALDVAETDEAYLARFDLPGIAPDDVEVHFEDGVLTVRGERSHRESEASEGLLRSERSFGSFYRSIRLPRDTNAGGVEATFEEGVLTVHVPKAEASRPRRIEVRSATALASGDGARQAEPTPEAAPEAAPAEENA